MILIDREDVIRLGMDKFGYPFFIEWEIGSPEAIATDYADIIAEGPFLCVVTDEDVWAGQKPNRLQRVAQKRADTINLRQWRYLADLYAEGMGITRQSLILRFSSVRRQTRRSPGRWYRWEQVYHWPEGGDLMWSALVYGRHPWIEVREHEGRRQVRYTG